MSSQTTYSVSLVFSGYQFVVLSVADRSVLLFTRKARMLIQRSIYRLRSTYYATCVRSADSADGGRPYVLKYMIKKSKQLIKESWNLVCDKAGCRYEDYYHPDKPYSRLHKWGDFFMAILLLVLIVIVGYVLVELYGQGQFTRLDLAVRVSPTALESGGDAHVDVMYENTSGQTLFDASLVLRPQNVLSNLVVDHDRFDYEKNTLPIGTIEPGANGHVSFLGDVLTSIVQPQSVHFVMNYALRSGDSHKQQEYFAAELIADSSVLDIDVVFPEALASGQEYDFVVSYTNHSTLRSFENIKISSYSPDGFLNENQNEDYVIEVLAPGESGEFVFKKKFETTESFVPLAFELAVIQDDLVLLQDEISSEISIEQPQVVVSHDMNADVYTPGRLVDFVMSYRNDEDFDISDMSVVLELDSRVWDIQGIPSLYGDPVVGGFEWVVGDVAVGEVGEITVPIRLFASQNRGVIYSPTNAVRTQVRVEYPHPEYEDVMFVARSEEVSRVMASDLRLSGVSRFFTNEGDQVGRGAYPPVVGQQSRYWVILKPQNNINIVENVVVTAQVSNIARCTGKQSLCEGSDMLYDPASGVLTWSLGTMDPDSPRNYGGAFEVAFTPTADQRGSRVTLLSNIQITGRDSLTGQTLTYMAPNIVVPDIIQ